MKKTVHIIALILALCLVFGAGAFAAGSSYTKELLANYVGVQLVVDGKTIAPKDANGNVVEPFIVDGTTYLPVRAVAEALDKEVTWDNDTKTVYIGVKQDDNPAPISEQPTTQNPVFKYISRLYAEIGGKYYALNRASELYEECTGDGEKEYYISWAAGATELLCLLNGNYTIEDNPNPFLDGSIVIEAHYSDPIIEEIEIDGQREMVTLYNYGSFQSGAGSFNTSMSRTTYYVIYKCNDKTYIYSTSDIKSEEQIVDKQGVRMVHHYGSHLVNIVDLAEYLSLNSDFTISQLSSGEYVFSIH